MFELMLLKWISDKIDTVFVTTISHMCGVPTPKNPFIDLEDFAINLSNFYIGLKSFSALKCFGII